jgi:hypothetical protein
MVGPGRRSRHRSFAHRWRGRTTEPRPGRAGWRRAGGSQDHDGHLSTITDVFSSSDGAAHALDLLWWPPTKIAGRELAGYLEGVDEAAGHVRGLPVDLEVGRADGDEIEVLSLH